MAIDAAVSTLTARALGAEVRKADAPEVGWKTMTRAEAAAWMPPGPWLTWHQDTFDWPPGATPLAWTDEAPQAFSHGRHLGLQFHPEATSTNFERWLIGHAAEIGGVSGLSVAALRADTQRLAPESEPRGKQVLTDWLSQLDL